MPPRTESTHRENPSHDEVLVRVQEHLPLFKPVTAQKIELAPANAGAYALMIHIGREIAFRRSRAEYTIPPDWYIYAGSAYGPGGIRARLRHHFRQDKPIHWHVDHLTVAADALEAVVLERGQECAIVSALTGSPAFRPAVGGLGSSDCRVCAAHLLRFVA